MKKKKNFLLIAFTGTFFLAAGCSEKKPETVAAAPAPAPSTLPPSPTAGPSEIQPKAEEPLTVTAPLIVEHQVDVTAQRDHHLAGDLAEQDGGGVLRVGQLFPDGMHDAGVLPHRQIQENALRGEESLHSLLRPAGEERYH